MKVKWFTKKLLATVLSFAMCLSMGSIAIATNIQQKEPEYVNATETISYPKKVVVYQTEDNRWTSDNQVSDSEKS